MFFLLSADFFSKLSFSKDNSFMNAIRVSSSLDPDHDHHSVGPYLGLNCLRRQKEVDASKKRVKKKHLLIVTQSLLNPSVISKYSFSLIGNQFVLIHILTLDWQLILSAAQLFRKLFQVIR